MSQSNTPRGGRRSKNYVYSNTPGALDLENMRLANLIADTKAEPGSSIPTAPTIANTVAGSGSSSSLSPASILQSPIVAIHGHEVGAAQISDGASVSSEDSHQPPPADRIQQYQVFGSDPSTFDDPTIYHIREVIADMTDEEKKEIYCVASFPTDDLSDLIAGIPPDKDFSSAKPSNQVNANTFASYLEPYLRPLTEEDMAFLRERVRTVNCYCYSLLTSCLKGDRVTPFIMPRRGKKHYTEIWAEEDGLISADTSQNRERLPANQPRGNIEHMDDDISATEQISTGPILSRLLSALRYEHRPSANDEKDKPNGVTNGNGESSTNGIMHGEINGEHGGDATDDRLPPATSFPESTSQGWKIPSIKLDYAQVDERLKAELRHIGFLGPEEEPDYDAHKDDEIAERLRNLQAELKRISIVNGARKARLLDYYKEYMAHQEFTTIRDDLDTQVIQAYLKRNRTLSKGKKNIKRPGGAGGGSHFVAGSSSSGAGTAKPGVGDQVKVLIERRRRWIKVIGPIFDKEMVRVRTGKDSILEEAEMEPYMNAERDKWDEEVE